MRGKKRQAIGRTPSKVIINMNIAVEALNKTEIANLHHILDELQEWDDKNRHRFEHFKNVSHK